MPLRFNHITTIVWDKNASLAGIYDSEEVKNEFDGKIAEMQKNLKMFMGTGTRVEGDNTVTLKRRFSDAESANEWIAFNQSLATRYNKTIVSSSVDTV